MNAKDVWENIQVVFGILCMLGFPVYIVWCSINEKPKEPRYEYYFKDGIKAAVVQVKDTAHKVIYTLDVEIRNDSVIKIRFPNGGYLADDSIPPTPIDSNAVAKMTGVSGRVYVLHIKDVPDSDPIPEDEENDHYGGGWP